jgi:hypothetical protein
MKAAGVMKALTAGVPLVPVPLGRGQLVLREQGATAHA